ncbi:FimB/Mfa2 family fimbrial subunit [Chitinophaga sp. 22321]|uniref:Fimbrillin-A associated anchor protein Mfa1 and Mfa2 n=1 Tax=Chitinophaga hostae TaxID=2831022 RepID=A0ABS5IVR2_9BACT|nr:FimB/Mfa2 family fimbrial subunit [Chitinophaga hostae]MBS0026322.1 hypothetical protein [Chitinophaga hostae]
MKKKWFVALSFSVLFYACAKDNNTKAPIAQAPKVPIKVSVADFVKKVEHLPAPLGRQASSTTTLAKDSTANISDIYLSIFNRYGERVNFIHQKSTEGNFGIFSDSLPAGSYSIAAVAATDSLIIDYGISLNVDAQGDSILSPFPDIFYKKISIVVGTDTAANNFNLSLERLMACLEVNIIDAPAADSNVAVKMRYESSSYYIPGDTYSGQMTMSLKIPRRGQQIFNELIMNTSGEIEVDISYPDRNTNAILTKTIRHVMLSKNTKTVLTGNLYTTPTVDEFNSGFRITINSIWNPSETIPF